jgi:hypothetical protein
MHGATRGPNLRTFRATYSPDTSSYFWGDEITIPKPKKTFRYTFQNIQGLPINPYADKHNQIITAMTETEADVYGLADLT